MMTIKTDVLNTIVEDVLLSYGFAKGSCIARPFGSGLINHTWKVSASNGDFILQKVNDTVFKDPGAIANNIRLIAGHLKEYHPDYSFMAPLTTIDGQDLYHAEGEGYFRLFPFFNGSHSKDIVQNADQAYEAARQFGLFTRLLSDIDIEKLRITLPNFHDLSLRYNQFENALQNGNPVRIAEADSMIRVLKSYSGIVEEYRKITMMPDFKLRVTHHDTKISNVLFGSSNEGLTVIDLDTVMPGFFISDMGDMMRTYLCPVSEEEKDFSKIHIRTDIYEAIIEGYIAEMHDELSKMEKQYFFYSGKFLIYMQSLRFLTDFLLMDRYYGAKYEGHNLVRAKNQAVLLEEYCSFERFWHAQKFKYV
jgi:Ser/Thr protein kinase RdoA (MazF antagonist)